MTEAHFFTSAPTSAADIVITDAMLNPQAQHTTRPTDAAAPDETAAIFRRLRRKKESFGWKPNKDHLAAALIGVCILEGFDERPRIVGALRTLGIKPNHATGILNAGTGDDPSQHRWWINSVGRYRLHSTTK